VPRDGWKLLAAGYFGQEFGKAFVELGRFHHTRLIGV
jgi:hypothetical protein